MGSNNKQTAQALYKERFNKTSLFQIYEDKISESHAIGRDGTTQEIFRKNLEDEVGIILRKVGARSYRFTRFREKLISKGSKKPPRIISIPTIRDRLTLRVLNDIVFLLFKEAGVRRPHAYIKEIREALANKTSPVSFVRVDVENFYPSIVHKILLRKLRAKIRKREIIDLVLSALTTPTGSEPISLCGVPQGLSISNILASVYLLAFDEKMKKKYKYFRYVDDILVLSNPAIATKVFDRLAKELKKLGLSCHPLGKKGKSQITDETEGVEYLGFKVTPASISVRDSSFTRMIENLLKVLTAFRHASEKKRSEDRLVWQLNLKITGCIYQTVRYGWVFFFSQITAVNQLARLDRFVTKELERRDIAHLRPRIKRFTRAYHEITKNLDSTRYIPDWDNITLDQIIIELSFAEGMPPESYSEKMTEKDIRKRFARLIRRQTRELERDLIEVIS